MGNHRGVRRVDLDGVGVNPCGHEALERWWNRVVLVRDKVPGRNGLPGGDTRLLTQRRERCAPLRDGHDGRRLRGNVDRAYLSDDALGDVAVKASWERPQC